MELRSPRMDHLRVQDSVQHLETCHQLCSTFSCFASCWIVWTSFFGARDPTRWWHKIQFQKNVGKSLAWMEWLDLGGRFRLGYRLLSGFGLFLGFSEKQMVIVILSLVRLLYHL